MPAFAYLFERFPSFGQTFCYREVAELIRQDATPRIFSNRKPNDEPPQPWDPVIASSVEYLPDEAVIVPGVARLIREGKLPEQSAAAIAEWGRKPDFLRLYQAAFVGLKLKDAGIRHVHAHFAGMAARTAFWIHRFFDISFSFTAHANDIFAPRGFTVSLADLVDAADAVITVSDYSARFLREAHPGCASKIHRIYNGIDLGRFSAATFERQPPLIISVGRLIEKKGFADLVAACAVIKERKIAFECEIVGEGPLLHSLQEQIRAAGLQDKVTLVGPLAEPQIAARLRTATVFALPCAIEEGGGMDNLPTVIMEAMATALPVISTPIAGVPEMVVDRITGILVPPHEPTGLASAVIELLGNPDQARRLGLAGRRLAEERFAIEASVRSLRSFFG